MMTTLDRMFLVSFARSYLVVWTSLVSLYVVIDLFTNIDDFGKPGGLVAAFAIASDSRCQRASTERYCPFWIRLFSAMVSGSARPLPLRDVTATSAVRGQPPLKVPTWRVLPCLAAS